MSYENALIEVTSRVGTDWNGATGQDYHYGILVNRLDKVGFLCSWHTDSATKAVLHDSASMLCPCCIRADEMKLMETKVTELKQAGELTDVFFDLLVGEDEKPRTPTTAEFAYGEEMELIHTYKRLPLIGSYHRNDIYGEMIRRIFDGKKAWEE